VKNIGWWLVSLMVLALWQVLPATAAAESARPPLPGVYVDSNGRILSLPGWAAGAAWEVPWQSIAPSSGVSDFGAVNRWLTALAQNNQKGILSVTLTCSGSTGDGCAPAWSLGWDPIMVDGQARLNLLDSRTGEEISHLIDALSSQFAGDPRLAAVMIAPGWNGSASPCAAAEVSASAPEACAAYLDHFGVEAWSRYQVELVRSYAAAFERTAGQEHTPLQVAINGQFVDGQERAGLVATALSVGVGLHDATIAASFLTGERNAGRCAQDWLPAAGGYRDEFAYASHWVPLQRSGAPVSVSARQAPGKSEAALTNEESAWWSVLNALGKRASVLVADADGPKSEDAFKYFQRYAGKSARTTPDAWIAFHGGSDAWCGDTGDYGWYLVHRQQATGDSRMSLSANERGGRTAKGWQGAYSRSTDLQMGTPALYLDLDDAFMYGGERAVQVEVTYWDGTPDMAGATWELAYDATGSAGKLAGSVTLRGSDRWVTQPFTLLDATFRNRLPDQSGQPGNDLRLLATGRRDIRFHMVRVRLIADLVAAPTRVSAAGTSVLVPTPARPAVVASAIAAQPVVNETATTEGPESTPHNSTPTPPAPVPTPTPTVAGIDVVRSQTRAERIVVRDTYVSSAQAEDGFGSANTLVVDGAGTKLGLVAFDLTDIPDTAKVNAAWLEMSVVGRAQPQPLQLSVYPMSIPWSDSQASWLKRTNESTWNAAGPKPGVDYVNTPLNRLDLPPNGLVQVLITEQVEQWIRHPESNFGVLLQGSGEASSEYYFISSEWHGVVDRPRLRIRVAAPLESYTPAPTPSPTPAPTGTPIAVPNALAISRNAAAPLAYLAHLAAYETAAGGTVNFSGYILAPDGKSTACDFNPAVRLWGAPGQKAARMIATGTRELVTIDGLTYPEWRFLGVDLATLQGKDAIVSFFMTVDGVRSSHNIVTLGAERGTDYPKPVSPEVGPEVRPDSVDASIEILWPHEGNNSPEPALANLSVALFRSGTRETIPARLSFLPVVRLHWSLNDGPDLAGNDAPVGKWRLIQTPWSTYYLWDFPDIDVRAAREPGNYLNYWVEVTGVDYTTNVWSHGMGSRPQLQSTPPTSSCHG
jgi:hypothetical protein